MVNHIRVQRSEVVRAWLQKDCSVTMRKINKRQPVLGREICHRGFDTWNLVFFLSLLMCLLNCWIVFDLLLFPLSLPLLPYPPPPFPPSCSFVFKLQLPFWERWFLLNIFAVLVTDLLDVRTKERFESLPPCWVQNPYSSLMTRTLYWVKPLHM